MRGRVWTVVEAAKDFICKRRMCLDLRAERSEYTCEAADVTQGPFCLSCDACRRWADLTKLYQHYRKQKKIALTRLEKLIVETVPL